MHNWFMADQQSYSHHPNIDESKQKNDGKDVHTKKVNFFHKAIDSLGFQGFWIEDGYMYNKYLNFQIVFMGLPFHSLCRLL